MITKNKTNFHYVDLTRNTCEHVKYLTVQPVAENKQNRIDILLTSLIHI